MNEISKILESFPTPDLGPLAVNLRTAQSVISEAQKRGEAPPHKWTGNVPVGRALDLLNDRLKRKGWKLDGDSISSLLDERSPFEEEKVDTLGLIFSKRGKKVEGSRNDVHSKETYAGSSASRESVCSSCGRTKKS